MCSHRVVAFGGGSFILACEDFGRMFDNSFPACTFFVLKWRFPLFRPGSVHSGSAS